MAAMNLDQRKDDQPIPSGELPVVTGPSETSVLSPRTTNSEETPFSKWNPARQLFVADDLYTLWAGPIRPTTEPIMTGELSARTPEALWRGSLCRHAADHL